MDPLSQYLVFPTAIFGLHFSPFNLSFPPLQSFNIPSSSSSSSSTMADNNPRRKSKSKPSATTTTSSDDGYPDESDAEVWASFDQNFRQVQSVLDRNRVLIQQVNENHQSRIPSNMVHNVALIQELNGNISKVVNMYSDFSSDFTTVFNNNKSRNPKRGATTNLDA